MPRGYKEETKGKQRGNRGKTKGKQRKKKENRGEQRGNRGETKGKQRGNKRETKGKGVTAHTPLLPLTRKIILKRHKGLVEGKKSYPYLFLPPKNTL